MPPTNADYAKINIACKDLGIDKHQLISDRYKIESSKQLTRWQLADLYKHFTAQGWKVKRTKKSNASPKYRDAVMRKVVALWITLAQAGVIRSSSDQALQAYVKRLTGLSNLKWCGAAECNILIESLKSWAKRENVDIE
jgi:phage gp16-like protein